MPRIRSFRHSLLAVAFLLAATPAAACLPPPPGTPEPVPVPRDQVLHSIILTSTDIVSGTIVGTLRRDGRHRFRIEQVYKGNLRPGAILTAWHGWGLDAPMCAGMIPPPPVSRGMRGTVFFYGEPQLRFLTDQDMERILALGLLQPPPQRRGR